MGLVSKIKKIFASQSMQSDSKSNRNRKKIESTLLEKDSEDTGEFFKLGLAAGYTGKSIKNIEDSLNRIESLVATKDWFKKELQPLFSELNQNLKEIKTLMERNQSITGKIDLKSPTQRITPKMKEMISIVRSEGVISYLDLSKKMGITIDSLRGLLSRTAIETSDITRFQKDKQGWVKYMEDSDSIDAESNSIDEEESN